MKIICVGRNYVEHIIELENERPDSPVIFLKPETSIIHKNQPFFIPSYSKEKLKGKKVGKKFADDIFVLLILILLMSYTLYCSCILIDVNMLKKEMKSLDVNILSLLSECNLCKKVVNDIPGISCIL